MNACVPFLLYRQLDIKLGELRESWRASLASDYK